MEILKASARALGATAHPGSRLPAACSTLNGALIGRCRRSLEGSRGTSDGEAQQNTLISGVVEQKASYCMSTQTGLSNDHADP